MSFVIFAGGAFLPVLQMAGGGGLLLPGAPRTALAYLSSECITIVVIGTYKTTR